MDYLNNVHAPGSSFTSYFPSNYIHVDQIVFFCGHVVFDLPVPKLTLCWWCFTVVWHSWCYDFAEKQSNKESVDCTPPDYIMPGSKERPLQPLHLVDKDQKVRLDDSLISLSLIMLYCCHFQCLRWVLDFWALFHKTLKTSLHGLTGLHKDVFMFYETEPWRASQSQTLEGFVFV